MGRTFKELINIRYLLSYEQKYCLLPASLPNIYLQIQLLIKQYNEWRKYI